MPQPRVYRTCSCSGLGKRAANLDLHDDREGPRLSPSKSKYASTWQRYAQAEVELAEKVIASFLGPGWRPPTAQRVDRHGDILDLDTMPQPELLYRGRQGWQ